MRENYEPPRVDLTVISGLGGLGDTLARLPALRHLNEQYKHVSVMVYIQDGWLNIVKYLLPERPRLQYKALSEAPFYPTRPYIEFDNDRFTTLHMHLTDHAYLMLMDKMPPSDADRAYWEAPSYIGAGLNYLLKDAGLAEKPYIVFTTDYTAPVRQWPAVHINRLAGMVREAGLTPALLGSTEPIPTGVQDDPIRPEAASGLKKELFVDLRGKTSLAEALGVMQRAKAVVGVDNGLLHLAGYTSVPVITAYTSLLAAQRDPVREAGVTKVLQASVPCTGCQSKSGFMNYDRRICIFDDYACTLTLTAELFYARLKEMGVVK